MSTYEKSRIPTRTGEDSRMDGQYTRIRFGRSDVQRQPTRFQPCNRTSESANGEVPDGPPTNLNPTLASGEDEDHPPKRSRRKPLRYDDPRTDGDANP